MPQDVGREGQEKGGQEERDEVKDILEMGGVSVVEEGKAKCLLHNDDQDKNDERKKVTKLTKQAAFPATATIPTPLPDTPHLSAPATCSSTGTHTPSSPPNNISKLSFLCILGLISHKVLLLANVGVGGRGMLLGIGGGGGAR